VQLADDDVRRRALRSRCDEQQRRAEDDEGKVDLVHGRLRSRKRDGFLVVVAAPPRIRKCPFRIVRLLSHVRCGRRAGRKPRSDVVPYFPSSKGRMAMRSRLVLCAALVVTTAVTALGATAAGGDPIAASGAAAKWTSVYRSPLAIEGLTGDHQGNLYIAQRGGSIGCPILRLRPPAGVAVLVGTVPAPCSPSGLTFDSAGKLYVTGVGSAQDAIDVLTPNSSSPP